MVGGKHGLVGDNNGVDLEWLAVASKSESSKDYFEIYVAQHEAVYHYKSS